MSRRARVRPPHRSPRQSPALGVEDEAMSSTMMLPQAEAYDAPADLVEHDFDLKWSDGFPVVPPTQAKIDAVVDVLGGEPDFVEAGSRRAAGNAHGRCSRSTR